MSVFIENLIHKISPLQPIPTATKSNVSKAKVKALLFDIYGTLLISASGDTLVSSNVEKKFITHSQKLGVQFLDKNQDKILQIVSAAFSNEIKEVHLTLRNHGYPYPEVNIVEIWRSVLDKLEKQNHIRLAKKIHYKEFSFLFELDNNPVFPMPNMKKVLEELNPYFLLGIVSNAQVYTPILMNYFLHKKVEEDFITDFFQKELQFYSYKELRAKPDVYLYEKAKKALLKKNIDASEVLYIGNDMLKDIWAAQQVGFKTVLFAGDKRSLRRRENYELVRNCTPDFVINDLSELIKICL